MLSLLADALRGLLVIAAHADDEILGAGATIALAVRRSIPVHIVVLSHSVTSRNHSHSEATALKASRASAAGRAAQRLGATFSLYDLPDNAFDSIPFLDVVHIVESELAQCDASVVLSHSAHDLSRDHQVTAQATVTAARPATASAPSLFAFEVRSASDWTFAGAPAFNPALWVGVDDEAWATKLDCLGIYHDELRAWPHPRSVEGIDVLSRYRGSQVGLDRAEAFVVIRAVEQ